MSLDDISLSEDGASPESQKEQNEKQKESSRKAQAQLQKTQKDEKKAKADSDDLFGILHRFLQNPLYDEIVTPIFDLLRYGFPSRFVLILTALIYYESSLFIFTKQGKNHHLKDIHSLFSSERPVAFEENTLHQSLRSWISLWMMTSQEYITHHDSSTVLLQKLSLLFRSEQRKIAVNTTKEVFSFFLKSKNIIIEPDKSRAYAEFIISQIDKSVSLVLDQADADLKRIDLIEPNSLFGV